MRFWKLTKLTCRSSNCAFQPSAQSMFSTEPVLSSANKVSINDWKQLCKLQKWLSWPVRKYYWNPMSDPTTIHVPIDRVFSIDTHIYTNYLKFTSLKFTSSSMKRMSFATMVLWFSLFHNMPQFILKMLLIESEEHGIPLNLALGSTQQQILYWSIPKTVICIRNEQDLKHSPVQRKIWPQAISTPNIPYRCDQ
jgi:hypothetical protein